MSPGRRVLVVVGVALFVAVLAAFAAKFPLDPDVAWYISVARRMLAGEHLYTDIVEVNPPLIVYLMVVPAVMADGLRMTDHAALAAFTIGVILFSLGLSVHLFVLGRRVDLGSSLLLIVAVTALLIIPVVDFGQREHLMVTLALPYVVAKWRRSSGLTVPVWEGWLCGVAAGLGFALKPFFVPVWLAIEGLSLLQRRPLRRGDGPGSETLGVVVVLVLYAAFSVVVHPEYFTLMLELSGIYRSYGQDGSALRGVVYALPLLALTLGYFLVPARPELKRLAAGLLVFAAASLLMGAVQGKGWRYHFLPGIVMLVLALGVLAEAAARSLASASERRERMRAVGVIAMIMMAAYPLALRVTAAFAFQQRQRTTWQSRASTLAPYRPKSLLVMGDFVADAYPLANNLGADHASPFPSLWWIHAIREAKATGGGPPPLAVDDPVERDLFDRLVADFVRIRPDLVLVDTAEQAWAGGAPFPYVEYLSQDSSFAAAWVNYSRVGSLERFVVLRRLGTAAPADRPEPP